MKKTITLLVILFILITLVVGVAITQNNKQLAKIRQINQQYEIYLDKEIYGTDVASIINKIVDFNSKNQVAKNEEGIFLENDTNSIKGEIQFLYDEEVVTHPVEAVYNRGLNSFISNFNVTKFKLITIQYHEQTKQVSLIVLKQLEQ